MPASPFEDGDPFCTQCGFLLRGHEAAPRCPECSAPLPAALGRFDKQVAAQAVRCVRRESTATLFGWPLVSVALGPDRERGERLGKARGIIAIGDVAVGGVAIGGGAVGIVAIGGGAIGVASIGGGAIGLLAAVGGGALGGTAVGGIAAGGLATGGVALGFIVQGGAVAGVYARGASAQGRHVIDGVKADPAAVRMFDAVAPVMGVITPPAPMPANIWQPAVAPIVLSGLLAALIGALVVLAQRRHDAKRLRRTSMFDDITAPPAPRSGSANR
jgi:hypothetical protein